MFCPKCGRKVDEPDVFCRSCGQTLSADTPASTGVAPVTIGTGIVGAGNGGEPTKRSGEATASFILGLFSFIPVVGLLAVIFGHLARASIRRSGGRLLGDGMAVLGLLLGYLGLGGWVMYGLTIIINPLLPGTRMVENQREAVGWLRTINTACITYASTYDHGFPKTLAAMGPLKTENSNTTVEMSEKAAGLIPDFLASGTGGGYQFTYVAGKPDETGRINTYTVHADPITPGETGDKYYFTDQSEVIRLGYDYRTGKMGEANADSPPLPD